MLELDFMKKMMKRCLTLASKGNTRPNPMVGSVLATPEGEILSEGYHKHLGSSHAEVETLKNWNEIPEKAILFVNLEPCYHYGKTPPCTKLIIAKKIKKVIIGTKDPNPLVNGKGIEELKRNHIETQVGILEKECYYLNRIFMVNQKMNRAYVALKVASSLDGKIALSNNVSQWITNSHSLKKAHQLRSELQAVAVGKNTLTNDNPKLTNRVNTKSIQPARVLFLAHGEIPFNCHFLMDRTTPRFLMAGKNVSSQYLKKLDQQGVNTLVSSQEYPEPQWAVETLYRNKIYSVLVEGGSRLITSFIKNNLADSIYLFLAPSLIGSDGLNWCGELKLLDLKEQPRWNIRKIQNLSGDLFVEATSF